MQRGKQEQRGGIFSINISVDISVLFSVVVVCTGNINTEGLW